DNSSTYFLTAFAASSTAFDQLWRSRRREAGSQRNSKRNIRQHAKTGSNGGPISCVAPSGSSGEEPDNGRRRPLGNQLAGTTCRCWFCVCNWSTGIPQVDSRLLWAAACFRETLRQAAAN